MYDESVSVKGPSGIALVLGIIGILIGLAGGFVFGIVGGIAGIVCALAAFILGIAAKKKTNGRNGKGGIILGIFAAVVSAVMLLLFGSVIVSSAKDAAEKYDCPLVMKHAESFKYGLVGVLSAISEEGDDSSEQFYDELTKISENLNN